MNRTPEEREQSVRTFYAGDHHWFDTGPSVKIIDWKLIDEFDAVRGKTVLDVGPHYPSDALHYSHLAKEWHCVDFLPEVIERGRALVPNVQWQVADARALPFAENYFDTILSMSTVDHIPTIEGRVEAHQSAARVLKPGGLYILIHSNRLYENHPEHDDVGFGYERWHYLYEMLDEVMPSGLKIIHYDASGHHTMPRVGSIWIKP